MDTKNSLWIFVGCIIIAALFLGFVIEAKAETMKWRTSSYTQQMEILPVGDSEGHGLLMGSNKGQAYFENGDVAVYANWWTGDATLGRGATLQGYARYTFEDGSTFVGKFETTLSPGPKGLPLQKGTAKLIKGTGRFEGIQGDITFEGRALVPYSKEKGLWGDMYFDAVATYTLPRK
jgi:hypothetical protein